MKKLLVLVVVIAMASVSAFAAKEVVDSKTFKAKADFNNTGDVYLSFLLKNATKTLDLATEKLEWDVSGVAVDTEDTVNDNCKTAPYYAVLVATVTKYNSGIYMYFDNTNSENTEYKVSESSYAVQKRTEEGSDIYTASYAGLARKGSDMYCGGGDRGFVGVQIKMVDITAADGKTIDDSKITNDVLPELNKKGSVWTGEYKKDGATKTANVRYLSDIKNKKMSDDKTVTADSDFSRVFARLAYANMGITDNLFGERKLTDSKRTEVAAILFNANFAGVRAEDDYGTDKIVVEAGVDLE